MDLAEIVLRKLNLDPEQIRAAVFGMIEDARRIKTEVLGAKDGFQNAVRHFDARLVNIERSLARIEKALNIPPEETLLIVNGAAKLEAPKNDGSKRPAQT